MFRLRWATCAKWPPWKRWNCCGADRGCLSNPSPPVNGKPLKSWPPKKRYGERERPAAQYEARCVKLRSLTLPVPPRKPIMSKELRFSPQLFTFLEELKANNNRDWFEANRHRYVEFV